MTGYNNTSETSSEFVNKHTENDESTFNVVTYSLLDKNVKYCHWSEGLTMIIEKDGVTITLNEDEIKQIVKALPRTISGCY